MISLTVNDVRHEIDVTPETPLLWALRENLGLTGTKFGCGVAQCGACLVHVDGQPALACVVPVASVAGKAVTTIEGLSGDGSHPVQAAWLDLEVPQCGYCQPGQIMAAVALLREHPRPSDAQIDEAMAGVLCRCGTYQRIRAAIKRAAGMEEA